MMTPFTGGLSRPWWCDGGPRVSRGAGAGGP
ncbi:MAG: hypothetical protein QOI83_1124, partial [Streptomycetaceae bacterium]|nr:hypothetical protein [Streptomycetaceae bacterium]